MNVDVLLSTLFAVLAIVCVVVAIILGVHRQGLDYTPAEERLSGVLLIVCIVLVVLTAPLIALAAGIDS